MRHHTFIIIIIYISTSEDHILIMFLVQHVLRPRRVVQEIIVVALRGGRVVGDLLQLLLLLPRDPLLVLDLLEPVELLALQLVQLGDDVGQGPLDPRDDHMLDGVDAPVGAATALPRGRGPHPRLLSLRRACMH